MDSTHRYRGGLVWPVILIGAGVVFLLNNLGVLGWGVWETLFRLWPVLLIAIGLDILVGRRSMLGSGLVALLLLVALGAAIWIGGPVSGWTLGEGAGVDRTETVSEDLKGAERADVEISFGTGVMNLAALPEGSGQLLKGTLDLSKNERYRLSYSGSGGTSRLKLDSEGAWQVGPGVVDQRKAWDLELNRDIPLNLSLDTGVGRAILDLTQLNLTGLEVDGGVGQVSVKLPARGRYAVRVDGGIGEITLIVPQGLGVQLRADGGLGGVDVEGDFIRQDRLYTSRSYNSAEHRADIRVSGGIGRIRIQEVRE